LTEVVTAASMMLILLFSVHFATPFAATTFGIKATRPTGVRVGDWIKYGDFIAMYESNDPDAAQAPADIVEHNNTDWIRNTVVDVTGTTVIFESLIRFKHNDTQAKSTENVDIESGDSSSESRAAFMFVGADLGEGDTIYTSDEFVDYKIAETISREYLPEARRKTHHFNSSASIDLSEDQILVLSVEYYWDKETGILCEHRGLGVLGGTYTTYWSKSYKIVGTNVSWVDQNDEPSDSTEGYPPVIFVVAAILAGVPTAFLVWKLKSRKPRRRRTGRLASAPGASLVFISRLRHKDK
jgi:hypothetical protein